MSDAFGYGLGDKDSGKLVTVREDVIRFLLGEGELDGYWYGDQPAKLPKFWWRNPLRLSMHPHTARSSTPASGGNAVKLVQSVYPDAYSMVLSSGVRIVATIGAAESTGDGSARDRAWADAAEKLAPVSAIAPCTACGLTAEECKAARDITPFINAIAKVNGRRCTNPQPVGDSACDCCQHHWHALDFNRADDTGA